MDKLYTRTGDDGYTGLLGKSRVPKYHPIPEVVGTLDEVMASLGLARAFSVTKLSFTILIKVQRDLYAMMAEISASPDHAEKFCKIDSENVIWLESNIDDLTKKVDMPFRFILPGDTKAGATLSVARTVIRRAERQMARLYHDGLIKNPELLRYINRLSSLCYILELYETRQGGKKNITRASEV
jgi:cob(I)alamin adenosyltransferase